MDVVETKEAPAAIGPYSQGVVAGGLLFASGQIALDPATGELVGDTAAEQAEQVMRNVGALLAAAGYAPGTSATTSTSTSAPFGRPATCTAERAGK